MIEGEYPLIGFWDILNARNGMRPSNGCHWLEGEFSLSFAKIQYAGTVRHSSEAICSNSESSFESFSQLELIDVNRQILPNQQYNHMQMLICCMPIYF